MPYLSRLNRTRLLQDKCRTLLNTTVRFKMKLLCTLLFALIALSLAGCDRSESSAYSKLKAKTGATDEELEKGIKIYTDFYILMRDEIEAGTLNVEDMIDAAKQAKEVMATVQRDDEMTAAMTLAYLRTLESQGSERASEAMAKQLSRFVKAEFPSTENSKMIREKIQEYAKTSEAFHDLKQQSEQGGAGQPATRPELKSEGSDKPQPESEGRSR